MNIDMAIKKLLVIDDNPDNLVLIQFALETFANWEVLTAKNGLDGITEAETERPDAILIDFLLPDMNGLEVCEILKSNLFTCAIPIVFITAMAQKKTLAKLSASSAEGIIVKPFDIDKFDSQIAKFCNWNLVS